MRSGGMHVCGCVGVFGPARRHTRYDPNECGRVDGLSDVQFYWLPNSIFTFSSLESEYCAVYANQVQEDNDWTIQFKDKTLYYSWCHGRRNGKVAHVNTQTTCVATSLCNLIVVFIRFGAFNFRCSGIAILLWVCNYLICIHDCIQWLYVLSLSLSISLCVLYRICRRAL